MLPRTVAGRIAAVLAVAGALVCPPPRPAEAHAVHLSHTRLVVDGRSVIARIRIFEDDLHRALSAERGAPAALPAGAALDSLVAAYVRPRFGVTADGVRLVPRVLETGAEHDEQGERMRWLIVELRAARPVRRVVLRDAILFETFADQRNVVSALRLPGSQRASLYFVAGGKAEQPLPL